MASSPPAPESSGALLDLDAEPEPDAELIANVTAHIDAESLRVLVDGAVRFVGGDGDTAFALRLCLAELHSNAVRHAGGATRVRVWSLPVTNRLLVAVGDKCRSAPPRCAEPSPDAEEGRGLMLVEAHSAANGHVVHAAGKDVWFAVVIARPPQTRPPFTAIAGAHDR